MGVASGCGEQEVGVASESGWNLWVWLLGVVLRRYIYYTVIIESVDSISRDELDVPLTQYITNA